VVERLVKQTLDSSPPSELLASPEKKKPRSKIAKRSARSVVAEHKRLKRKHQLLATRYAKLAEKRHEKRAKEYARLAKQQSKLAAKYKRLADRAKS
jgi:hypothetical protein